MNEYKKILKNFKIFKKLSFEKQLKLLIELNNDQKENLVSRLAYGKKISKKILKIKKSKIIDFFICLNESEKNELILSLDKNPAAKIFCDNSEENLSKTLEVLDPKYIAERLSLITSEVIIHIFDGLDVDFCAKILVEMNEKHVANVLEALPNEFQIDILDEINKLDKTKWLNIFINFDDSIFISFVKELGIDDFVKLILQLDKYEKKYLEEDFFEENEFADLSKKDLALKMLNEGYYLDDIWEMKSKKQRDKIIALLKKHNSFEDESYEMLFM